MKNKKEWIMIIFLILGPFLDVASFLGFPLSIIMRGLFLGIVTIILLFKKKKANLLLPILLFGLISFLYQYFYLKEEFSFSISTILKFLYLPISIIYLKEYLFPVKKYKVLSCILGTYIGIYLLSYIFQFGANAYIEAVGKNGFKGVFSSINEFSAILICLLPVVSMFLKREKKYLFLVILLITTILCSLLTGTKVLLGGILINIIYLLWSERNRFFFERTKVQKSVIIGSIIILIVVGGFLFTKTRTYQNMVVQQEFFQVKNVFSLEFVNKVVYNNRLGFLKENTEYFISQKPLIWFFGIGMSNPLKLVEIDPFDILFRYGIIGFIIFFGSILHLVQWKELKEEEKLSFVLLLLVSLTSGHVLIYPAVCIYFGILFSKEQVLKEK